MDFLKDWYERNFSDPQAAILAILLVVGFTVVLTLGGMLAPVLAAAVIAYLLEGLVRYMERRGLGRLWAVVLTFVLFMAFVVFVMFGLAPLLSAQVTDFVKELPQFIRKGQALLLQLPEHYTFITVDQVQQLITSIGAELGSLGQRAVTVSLSSIPGIITLLVYLILVPLLVFFFLKDKDLILGWFSAYMPRERRLTDEVWSEVDQQLGNYVRGKFWEIVIVGVVTYVTFAALGVRYAELLSVAVGLSVIIPYVGATVVTIPVAVVGFFQFGWSSDFAWLMFAYGIIQALDGNVLVPLLFSEVVNLHPVAIIVSILVFGGLWGFWGVFFAIPLATLVKAILSAWPRVPQSTATPPPGEGEVAGA
ncbi:MAG: AI-2E family transporter [Pseudomonadota bacterium]|nr:MAG: AI-2E family transporter [Pseudomonadota bacterium]